MLLEEKNIDRADLDTLEIDEDTQAVLKKEILVRNTNKVLSVEVQSEDINIEGSTDRKKE